MTIRYIQTVNSRKASTAFQLSAMNRNLFQLFGLFAGKVYINSLFRANAGNRNLFRLFAGKAGKVVFIHGCKRLFYGASRSLRKSFAAIPGMVPAIPAIPGKAGNVPAIRAYSLEAQHNYMNKREAGKGLINALHFR
jgi:hypothetical protein